MTYELMTIPSIDAHNRRVREAELAALCQMFRSYLDDVIDESVTGELPAALETLHTETYLAGFDSRHIEP